MLIRQNKNYFFNILNYKGENQTLPLPLLSKM